MTTTTHVRNRLDSDLFSIAAIAFIGLGIVLLAGFSQFEAVHNVAHDTRHAFGFACH
jgi:cobalt transporter subunit CbtB